MSKPFERLTIENFAGIKQLDLEIRPFTVLIGPQSVGKSITAKLLYFFKSVPLALLKAANAETQSSPEDVALKLFGELLPTPTHAGGSSTVTYSIGASKIGLKHTGERKAQWKISLPAALREEFPRLIEALGKTREEKNKQDAATIGHMLNVEYATQEAFLQLADQVLPGSASTPYFVPAGRSFYAQIERDFASFFQSATLDPFVAEFGKFFARIKGRRFRLREELPAGKPAHLLVENLLSGSYVREGQEDFIDSRDGRKLPPKLWSSGQQEAQPLALVLERYCRGLLRSGFLFIEEPEAHLFPTAQRTMTELVSLAFNAHESTMQIFITTHSPYILTTVNNLLLAGQLYQKRISARKKSALAKVVPADRALMPETVGAFYMDQDGCRSILDAETGLIGTSAIDEVSGNLNEQFDALLDFERL